MEQSPTEVKDKTVLVVDSSDKDIYDKPTITLTDDVKRIASIREWIVKNSKEKILFFECFRFFDLYQKRK